MLQELFLASYDPGASSKIIDEMYRTQTFQITPAPYTDEYGTHISSFFPVVQNGTVVAILTLDYEVSFVDSLLPRPLEDGQRSQMPVGYGQRGSAVTY